MDLKMLQWPREAEDFFDWMRQRGPLENVLEIGTGPGGFVQHLTRMFTDIVVSVDLIGSKDATGVSKAQAAKRNDVLYAEFGTSRLHLIDGDSHSIETQEDVALALDGWRVNGVFLDGDDTYEGKQKDYWMYSGYVGKGGWIATHDINAANTGVPQFWRELKSSRPAWASYEFSVGKHWGGIGVVTL